jgi:hypothetical protein
MPLEFALRPRFDLERPSRRRRLSWLRLHPLILPIGAYWLAAAGLTYAFIRPASVEVAVAAEHGLGSGDSSGIDTPSSGPPIQSPISAATARSDVNQDPTEQEQEPDPPDPVPPAEPLQDEPPSQQELDSVSRMTADDRQRPSRQAQPPVAQHKPSQSEVRQKARSLEPEPGPVEDPAPRRAELERELESEQNPRGEVHTGSLPSCENAAATANQTIDLGSARGAPDLTRDAFAGVLEHGTYLTQCAIPARTALEVCAAVRDGAVVGVTVTTEPRDPAINACVRRAVTTLRFPRNSQLDITRTRFEPVR